MPACSHILVVEDDLIIADLIDQILRFEGYQVSHVSDGAAAVAAVEQEPPDLVLMDLMLPAMSGLEAIARLKANARATIAQVPIIAMSAGVNLRLAAGLADGTLAKPFDVDALLAIVVFHLRRAADVGRETMMTPLPTPG